MLIEITSLSTTQSFSSWGNIRFDELLSSYSPTTGKRIICCIFIHKFTSCLYDFLIFSAGLTSLSRSTKKLKMAKEKNITSSSWPKKSKLLDDVRNSSNLRRSSCKPARDIVDDPI